MLYAFKLNDSSYGDPAEGNIIVYAKNKEEALIKFDEIALKEARECYEQDKARIEKGEYGWDKIVLPDIETFIKNGVANAQQFKPGIREFGDEIFVSDGIVSVGLFNVYVDGR